MKAPGARDFISPKFSATLITFNNDFHSGIADGPKEDYHAIWLVCLNTAVFIINLFRTLVNLGKSGLRVSKIILGCMTYGSPEWQPWLLGEEEGFKHIKAAYVFSGGWHIVYFY